MYIGACSATLVDGSRRSAWFFNASSVVCSVYILPRRDQQSIGVREGEDVLLETLDLLRMLLLHFFDNLPSFLVPFRLGGRGMSVC